MHFGYFLSLPKERKPGPESFTNGSRSRTNAIVQEKEGLLGGLLGRGSRRAGQPCVREIRIILAKCPVLPAQLPTGPFLEGWSADIHVVSGSSLKWPLYCPEHLKIQRKAMRSKNADVAADWRLG